jgi:hypothetical protein
MHAILPLKPGPDNGHPRFRRILTRLGLAGLASLFSTLIIPVLNSSAPERFRAEPLSLAGAVVWWRVRMGGGVAGGSGVLARAESGGIRNF